MCLSKAHLYDEADQLTSFYAGAITHPARLRIIRTLREKGPKTVFEIASEHPLSLSAISQHLEILRKRNM
jgi:DNA-binding transcriptional ArsR family regulator